MNKPDINKLSLTEKLAVIVSACTLAALALLLCLKLTLTPNYADFIVGNITWQAGTKFQDLIAGPVFIAVLFCGVLFFSLQLIKQKEQFGSDYTNKLSEQLIWWSIPSFAAIFGLILGTAIDEKIFAISAIGIIFIAIASTYNTSRKININPELFSITALAIILVAIIPLEIAIVFGRAPIKLVGDINLPRYEEMTYLVGGLGIIAGYFYTICYPKKLLQIFPKLFLIAQAGLLTLFITLYPARLSLKSGELIKYQTTIWLKILLIGIILWGIYDVINRYRKYSDSAEWVKLVSPVALFALLIGLKAGITAAPQISPDDYHFGEILLGWWSYLHGVIPYVGHLPAHGLIGDDLTQVFSFIFYDGSAGSMLEAGRLSYAVLAFATFISIYIYSGSIGLAFVSTFFVGGLLNWLFLTPFICLWFSRPLRESPSKWLSTWILTIPIVILGVPPQGVLLVAASGVMASYFAWRFLRNPEQRVWTGIVISLTILITFGLLTPFVSMLFGSIRYVLENGAINQVAYGVPWALSWNSGAKAGFIFEAVRMSWVAIPIACLIMIYASRKDHVFQKTMHSPAIVVLLLALLLIPYSMGRIDPGGISRPGLAAIFGWAILLPIAAWEVIKSSSKVPLILLVACMSAALNFSPLSFSNFVLSTSSKIDAGPVRDGPSAGLYNVGVAYVQDEHWDRLTRLNALLKSKLSPEETYLDLTSRNAQYFYLNRRPVMAVTAPYNMVPPSQQKRAVELLLKNLPTLALLEGSNITHDGGGLALRNPYLYRFIVENYTPRFEDGFIIGYRKDKLPNEYNSTIDIAVKNINDENYHRGVHREKPIFIIDDPVVSSVIKIGDEVRIANGQTRKISYISNVNNSIILEGPSIDSLVGGYPNKIQVVFNPQTITEYRVLLLQKAFSQSELQKIPVAWGRSEQSLKNKMTLVKGFEKISPSFHHLIPGNGNYKVNGDDPLLSFDISNLGLSGRDAGLLRFDLSCLGQSAEPRIQLFWWGDNHVGPFETSSVRFTADNGTLIVPLDASALWLTLKHINGVRIDLDNPTACTSFSVKNIGFFQRVF